jgi:hypothetical protein
MQQPVGMNPVTRLDLRTARVRGPEREVPLSREAAGRTSS